ncbi:MAG: HAD hydrolase family protein [Oscillospiraceae bacterium]|jgi:Cof subfamily protein (haloacid dehalogenase superfamily)|nr:HAD hydrolase family protein [Oscillospiraceae bacterium]MCI1989843.1 HAD hydrolase family protein [Oscillospiraceae bacterium]MCI2034932.1 HAD hydrolase family protein [Oscillospiraceae bacterium]
MNRKTIFFDLDGTLLGTRDGRMFQIPESAVFALNELKRNGHRVAVCSGRPEPFIHRFFPGLFRSFVASNGTHVVFEGHTVFDGTFPPERVRALMEHFDAFGCRYLFVGKNHAWARGIERGLFARLGANYALPGFLVADWKPEEIRANMMDFVFRDEEDYRRQEKAFTGGMVMNRHPGGLTADLSFADSDKASGIARFLEFSGIPREDTVAFGDGYNDISMMKAVGCGVAMGNAVDEVKEAADYVTEDLFRDGIYRGLKHLRLL